MLSTPSGKEEIGTASITRPSTTDSLMPKEDAENIFIDAVRSRMLGKTEESFDKYTLLASTGNLGATPHYELSRIWLEKNNVPKALAEIKIATQKDSVNKWFQTQLADLLAYDGQYVKAAGVYRKLADKDRHPEDFLFREAMLYQKAKKYKEALAVTDKLVDLLGDDDEAILMQRQQLYLNLNDAESAALEVEKLIHYYPYESKYAILLADIYQNNNITTKADEAYENALLKFPDDATVQFALMQNALKKNDTANFRRYIEKAVLNKSVPLEQRISLILPLIKFRAADSSGKEMVFDLTEKLATQEPIQIDALLFYADMLLADGRLDNAESQLKKAMALDSSRFSAWQQLLFIYSTKGNADTLIQYSETASKLFPEESLAYYFGGVGYMQAGKNQQAISFLKKALSLYRNRNEDILVDIWVTLGDLYNTERQFAASDSCYKVVLDLQPDNATALNNYSYYLSVRGEHLEEAAAMSAKSLKLRPEESTFLDTYGWILYKQGKYQESKDYLQRALDKNGDRSDATLWEHLGDVEFRLGNKEAALEHWKKALLKGAISESLQKKITEQVLND